MDIAAAPAATLGTVVLKYNGLAAGGSEFRIPERNFNRELVQPRNVLMAIPVDFLTCAEMSELIVLLAEARRNFDPLSRPAKRCGNPLGKKSLMEL